jgi:hypothetical protein
MAVVGAALVIRSRTALAMPIVASRLAWAGLAAIFFAFLTIPGIQLHGLLFGAEQEAVGWLEDAIKDGGITLAVSLAVLVPIALVLGPPWPSAGPAARPATSPGSPHVATAGHSASLVTTRTTHAGGDR